VLAIFADSQNKRTIRTLSMGSICLDPASGGANGGKVLASLHHRYQRERPRAPE
jgi:hypothetical protein